MAAVVVVVAPAAAAVVVRVMVVPAAVVVPTTPRKTSAQPVWCSWLKPSANQSGKRSSNSSFHRCTKRQSLRTVSLGDSDPQP